LFERRGPRLLRDVGHGLFRGRDSKLLRDTALDCWRYGLHSVKETQSLVCEGCGLQNAALEASHAVYRDAKISLALSR